MTDLPLRYLLALLVQLAPVGKPNIVAIHADDLGYGDLRCYNPDRLTIGGLAKQHTPVTSRCGTIGPGNFERRPIVSRGACPANRWPTCAWSPGMLPGLADERRLQRTATKERW